MNRTEIDSVQSVFELIDREIWIVTADAERESLPQPHGGMVATWAGPASIDPAVALVSLAVATNHFTHELIQASRAFALHLIAPEQIDLVWRFATGSGREQDKLNGLAHHRAMTGSPVLDHCLAWLDCRVLDEYTVGERCYYWAEVVASRGPASTGSGRPCPLRAHQLFAQASAEQLGLLRDGVLADIEAQRPLIEQWRSAKR